MKDHVEEYQKHIDYYATESSGWFSKYLTSSEWGNKDMATNFMKKYWLPKNEYNAIWLPVLEKIFIPKTVLPGLVFRSRYQLLASRGGCLFIEEEYLKFQQLMHIAADSHFVIIQNHLNDTGEPTFRMKFPVDTSWAELMSGNYISSMLFEQPYNDYFVFGKSESWGKYAANDYIHPLDIVGFKPELSKEFREELHESEEEWSEIKGWLPLAYHNLIKSNEK